MESFNTNQFYRFMIILNESRWIDIIDIEDIRIHNLLSNRWRSPDFSNLSPLTFTEN